MTQKLQQQLREVGSKLETPPSTKDALVKLLKVRHFLSVWYLRKLRKNDAREKAQFDSRVKQMELGSSSELSIVLGLIQREFIWYLS
jgi:hypothetical protein